MKVWLEISHWSLRDSVCVGRLINTTLILIALGFQGGIASLRAAAVSGGNRSSVKSRRWCQRRDGTDGNLDGDVEVEGCTTEARRESCSGSRGDQVMRVSLKIPAEVF